MLSIKAENEVNCYFKQLPTWFFVTFNSLKNLTNYGSIDLKSGGGFRLGNHPITEHRMLQKAHTTNENLWQNILAGEVEGRFVDLITPLEHDRIIFEYTELLLDSVR